MTRVAPAGVGGSRGTAGHPAPDSRRWHRQVPVHQHQERVGPGTFSPCRPIHYVVRPDNAPPAWAKMIAAAVKRVAKATGLVFIDDGATDEAPSQERDVYQPDRYGDRWAPVLITWATPAEVPDFGVDIAGEAGPVRVTSGDGTDTAYVSGTVALDPVKIDEIRTTMGEPVARAIIMHELGHLVGLAHTEHDDQLMFPRGNAEVTKYANGDRTGLATPRARPLSTRPVTQTR